MPGGRKLTVLVTTNRVAVDDVHLAGKLRGHPQFLAVGSGRQAPRPQSDDDVAKRFTGIGVNRMHEVASLGGDIDDLAVLALQHAFRFGAGRHLLHNDIALHVNDGKRGSFFVGDVDALALLVHGERFRARPGRELADHLQFRNVEDVDDVVVAASDVEQRMVGVEVHVARPVRYLDVGGYLVGFWIDDDDVVGLLVADKNQPGVFGGGGGAREQAEQQRNWFTHRLVFVAWRPS